MQAFCVSIVISSVTAWCVKVLAEVLWAVFVTVYRHDESALRGTLASSLTAGMCAFDFTGCARLGPTPMMVAADLECNDVPNRLDQGARS